MNVKDVKKLPWVSIEDWSDLPATAIAGGYGVAAMQYNVSEENIDTFITSIYCEISRKLQISYDTLESLLREENRAFYSFKSQLFSKFSNWCKNDPKLLSLEKMLRIPATDSVETCLEVFKKLSDSEKSEFLQKIEQY